jgi:hypothetical protein
LLLCTSPHAPGVPAGFLPGTRAARSYWCSVKIQQSSWPRIASICPNFRYQEPVQKLGPHSMDTQCNQTKPRRRVLIQACKSRYCVWLIGMEEGGCSTYACKHVSCLSAMQRRQGTVHPLDTTLHMTSTCTTSRLPAAWFPKNKVWLNCRASAHSAASAAAYAGQRGRMLIWSSGWAGDEVCS